MCVFQRSPRRLPDREFRPIDASSIAQNVTVTPSTVTRHYAADGLRVRETLFVPLDQPVLILLYQVDSDQPIDIDITFRPDFDLMWPDTIGLPNSYATATIDGKNLASTIQSNEHDTHAAMTVTVGASAHVVLAAE